MFCYVLELLAKPGTDYSLMDTSASHFSQLPIANGFDYLVLISNVDSIALRAETQTEVRLLGVRLEGSELLTE